MAVLEEWHFPSLHQLELGPFGPQQVLIPALDLSPTSKDSDTDKLPYPIRRGFSQMRWLNWAKLLPSNTCSLLPATGVVSTLQKVEKSID